MQRRGFSTVSRCEANRNYVICVYTQPTYIIDREGEIYRVDPEAGDVIGGTGGLRKLRFTDARRGNGKHGGLRVIYCWWDAGPQFWLFTVHDKGAADDLSPQQRKVLEALIKSELEARGQS